MVESDQIAQDVREIKWHQEAIDSSMELLIKANSEKILEEIFKFFGRSKRKAEVFLAVDGQRTVEDITDFLGMQKPNVSRHLTSLKEEGLVEIKKVTRGGYYVYKRRRVDKILGLSKKLKVKLRIQ